MYPLSHRWREVAWLPKSSWYVYSAHAEVRGSPILSLQNDGDGSSYDRGRRLQLLPLLDLIGAVVARVCCWWLSSALRKTPPPNWYRYTLWKTKYSKGAFLVFWGISLKAGRLLRLVLMVTQEARSKHLFQKNVQGIVYCTNRVGWDHFRGVFVPALGQSTVCRMRCNLFNFTYGHNVCVGDHKTCL